MKVIFCLFFLEHLAFSQSFYEVKVATAMQVKDVFCSVENAESDRTCIAYSKNEPSREFLTIRTQKTLKYYEIFSPSRPTYLESVPTTLRRIDGRSSILTVNYHHERGIYPGDVSYYPVSIRGKTPDEQEINVKLELLTKD